MYIYSQVVDAGYMKISQTVDSMLDLLFEIGYINEDGSIGLYALGKDGAEDTEKLS